ncbi:exodeoxyribonuclease VII large subunit [Clostridium tarantellae]|uniref:Exodeoxyribonuclease 7 large subunit n=1 Tax=Clostridium tarantellae TaxID=39493 RepID=A0A6I1MHA0_9CLOT|nr:exodeoxyribonuclease VII large subunit [Clostridium tarantellae]MPQ42755.1 exodeoxyribonuclease VII large subunit [Clostridium tarantellae]
MKLKILTVTEVNNYLKKSIDNDFILNNLSVNGEISNLKYHSSGHIYFSLKDDNSKINCIMFRDNAVNLNLKLVEGMKVELKASLSVYIKEGSYQLYCKEIKKIGVGELFEKFEFLKKELKEEGIFNLEYKMNIPKYPKSIGIITSPTGAAIRDIITVIKRRNKLLDMILYPALVQGNEATKTLIEGIKYFNNKKNVDVIIIGRGGGSIEELWAFNDKELAYEIFNSSIPVVSAVGHEVDYTICDFVSDIRAATPSAAAEIVSPHLNNILENIEYIGEKLENFINVKIKNEKNKLNFLGKILQSNDPHIIINEKYNEVNELNRNLKYYLNVKLNKEKNRIEGLNNILMALNPLNTLGRGYALITDLEDNIISNVSNLKNNKNVKIRMKDGIVESEISIKE